MRALLIMFFVVLWLPAICSANQIEQFLQSRTVLGQVYFPKGSVQLSRQYKQMLEDLSDALKRHHQSGRLVRVEGYASPEGHDHFNYNLSVKRALAIKELLREYGLESQLFFTGFGENHSSTDTLAKQRRVDLVIYKVDPAVMQLFKDSGQVERFVVK